MKLSIEVVLDGRDAEDGYDILSNILDAGTLQAAIEEVAKDTGKVLKVTSATLLSNQY